MIYDKDHIFISCRDFIMIYEQDHNFISFLRNEERFQSAYIHEI